MNAVARDRRYILVLGGHGFLGCHLVRRLATDGHRVRVLDRRDEPRLPLPDVQFIRGELSGRSNLEQVLADVDVVFHLVGGSLPESSNANPSCDIASSLVPTLHLLEACVKAGVRRVVFISSGGTVYGMPRSLPISEEHVTQPLCSYGITRLAIEKYLHLFLVLHGLEYVVCRAANAYGEGQDPRRSNGVVAVFLDRIRRGVPLQIFGDGDTVRDYIYASDAAEAFVIAGFSNRVGGIFNVGTGLGTSVTQLLSIVCDVTGLTPIVEKTPARPFDVQANVLDCTRIRQDVGWSAKIAIREGVERTWDWMTQGGRVGERLGH